jgi:PAS domain S-box-containing protein
MSAQKEEAVGADPTFRRAVRNLRLLFAAMAILLVVTTLITFLLGNRVIQIRNRASLHRTVIAQCAQLLSTLTDAETGQRGFIITGDEKYLAPYEDARQRLPQIFEQFEHADVIAQRPQTIGAIENLANAKLNELAGTIALRKEQGFDAATEVVRQGSGRETMEKLREQIGRLQDQQEAALEAEHQADDSATRTRTIAFALTGLANLLFIGWAYRRIVRAITTREAARGEVEKQRTEVQRQKDLLSVTLASIGDCVIVTDTLGRVTFMNGVAEELTGWSFNEARLRPITDVFKIINEFTRAPVENPVEKVMQTGVIVGLANHTLLIRRDGSEIPIDDSGAPIRDATGEIRGVVLVFRDFSEHKEHEQKLKEARDAAESANKAKDQFLAMLSHELRTPLTPVLATLNLWEASDELSPALHADAQMLRRSVELEARIIDDLLDLTRIAKGILTFSAEDTDVHEMIEYLVGMCHSEFRGKALDLSIQFDAPLHYVYTDAGRLQQVLWNIIKNAAKFTESDGKVSISTANDDQHNIIITIADSGIGMSRETLSRLFIPFEQGEQFISRRYGGLGLGMAISSALVEQLGGTLRASSDGLGKGSTFTVTFPAKPASDIKPKKPGAFDGRARSGIGVKILLVEDHADTALALTRLLKRQGYEVATADSVASALAAVKRETFELLVCDIGLPDGTGFQLIEEVRKLTRTPALALSGFGMEEDVRKSRQAGFEGHLTKPVNFQKLEAAIWQLTSKSSRGSTDTS